MEFRPGCNNKRMVRTVMKVWSLFLSVFFLSMSLEGQATAMSKSAAAALPQLAEPVCLKRPDGNTIQQVMEEVKIEDSELLARLVFAESLSTGVHRDPICRGLEREILEAITWGVFNRVHLAAKKPRFQKKYGDGLAGVIFKKGQFNPAISHRSRFSKYFLCPSRWPDWERLWGVAMAAVGKASQYPLKNPFLLTVWEKKEGLSLVTHFYYPKSSQKSATLPKWVDISDGSTTLVRDLYISGAHIKPECIYFFRLEQPFTVIK